jgi:hypothetical protein
VIPALICGPLTRLRPLPKTLDWWALQEYSKSVPEKKGNGFDSSNCMRRTTANRRYFFVHTTCVSYERRWWGGFGLPVSVCTGLSTLPLLLSRSATGQLINCKRRSPCQVPPAHLYPAHQHPAKARQRRPPRAQCAPGLSLLRRRRPSRRPNKACSGLFGRWTIAAKGSSPEPRQRKHCGVRVVARRPYGSFREVQHESDDDIGSSKCIR